MIRSITAVLACALAFPSLAGDIIAGDLRIERPVVFKSFAKARAAGGYMRVTNTGETDDLLIGVTVDGPMAMLHESREEDGVMRMIHLDAIEIPAGETVSFQPGGLHVMIMGLQPDDLPVGEVLDATLIFDRAGEVEVIFNVEELPADGKMMDHGGHSHDNS